MRRPGIIALIVVVVIAGGLYVTSLFTANKPPGSVPVRVVFLPLAYWDLKIIPHQKLSFSKGGRVTMTKMPGFDLRLGFMDIDLT